MITIKLKYQTTEENLSLIQKYQRQYNSLLHNCYQYFQKQEKLKSLFNYYKTDSELRQKIKKLNNIELLNSWFIQCAINEAFQLNEKKKIIFGGKYNFLRRCKGLITKSEYKNNKKLNPLYSIGTAKPYKGNQKFEITNDLETIIFKPERNTHIYLNINVKLKQNYKKILKKLYIRQQNKDLPITYKLDDTYIYICYEEDKLYKFQYNQIQNRVLGIDLNPNYIGWSIVDWKSSSDFKIIKSGIYSIKELNDKDFNLKNKHLSSSSKERRYITNKRQFETIQIVKNLINKAIYYKCQIISIENLNMKSSEKNKGKKFNKLINNLWNRKQFVNNLTKRCNIFNIKLIKVSAEYSSFIGNFLYRSLNKPDMILASIELSRRGYEFYNQYIIQKINIKRNIVQPNLNDFKNFYKKSLEEFQIEDNHLEMRELYNVFKKSKILYRLSIDKFSLQFSRFFTSKSYVKIANFD